MTFRGQGNSTIQSVCTQPFVRVDFELTFQIPHGIFLSLFPNQHLLIVEEV